MLRQISSVLVVIEVVKGNHDRTHSAQAKNSEIQSTACKSTYTYTPTHKQSAQTQLVTSIRTSHTDQPVLQPTSRVGASLAWSFGAVSRVTNTIQHDRTVEEAEVGQAKEGIATAINKNNNAKFTHRVAVNFLL